MKKYLILSLLTLFSLKCYFVPVSQKYDCETQMTSGEDPLDDRCGFELFFFAKAYGLYPNDPVTVAFYQIAVYDCYRQLELEEKCKKASPYIPVWPATQ